VIVTDPNGLTAIDGRATPNLPAFLGTNFDRPEDLEIKTLKNGKQMLFVATTTNHKVFSIDLRNDTVKLFASRDTLDMATGAPVGTQFTSPDNLAIDADGNMYIVEDRMAASRTPGSPRMTTTTAWPNPSASGPA